MRKILLWMALLLLAGCAVVVPFDPETEGVLDVIVRDGDHLSYYAVNASGRSQTIAPFEGDVLDVYEVDGGCYVTYKGVGNDGDGEFVNRLEDVRLWDENGCAVTPTAMLNEVLLAGSWLEHDLWKTRILRAGEEYFLYVELNVNWVSPCELYWYDQSRHGLVQVLDFDGLETVGLRVRDLSLLAQRPVYQPDKAGLTRNPLGSWSGQCWLALEEGGVNLIGPEGTIARQVTGFVSISSSSGDWAGFVSADGYHVLAEGKLTAYADLADVPETYAGQLAEARHATLNRFRFAYGDGDPQGTLESLKAQFERSRPLFDAVAQRLHACPELFDFARSTELHSYVTPEGWTYSRASSGYDERIGDRAGTPVEYLQDDGFLAPEEWAQLQTLLDTTGARCIGSEHGAVYVQFAAMMLDGRTIPARLYYAPEAETAVACASAWPVWEELGGGWYMGALTAGPITR